MTGSFFSGAGRTMPKMAQLRLSVCSYKNRMPLEIVEAFEHEGFIWGGQWAHYDTMHFEYRPELLPGR